MAAIGVSRPTTRFLQIRSLRGIRWGQRAQSPGVLRGGVLYNADMVVTVDEAYMPLTLTAPGISDEQFVGLCQQYEDYRVEYTAAGDLLVMPPTDPETSARNLEIEIQLGLWVRAHQQIGIATESSGGFKLPNGARLSPDAAWISRLRL